MQAAGSTPPPGLGPNANGDQAGKSYPQSGPPLQPNGHGYNSPSRSRAGPYDPYANPNQYGGPAPSGPNDSRSVPTVSSEYPSRSEYIRSHSATANGGQGGMSANGDPRLAGNGGTTRNPWSSPSAGSGAVLPPRGPAGAPIEPSAARNEREIPTGPSGKPRTPRPESDPRNVPIGPQSHSQLASQSSITDTPAGNTQTPSNDSIFADDDITELSSLAKLRQFKASIATKRSKQAHDVDSDAVAEMAASFSAPTSAAPSTASTLGLTPGHPDGETKPDVASGPESDAASANKAREQELKERLKMKAMKQEGASTPNAPSSDIAKAPVDRKAIVDGQSGVKHKMEDGEIAEAKRARLELMPSTAGTTDESQITGSTDSDDPMRSAGKRKRAAEWMKTTSVPLETPTEPAVKQEKPEVKPPVLPAAPAFREERSLESRVEKDMSEWERRQLGLDRSKPKDLKARARSRSPNKSSRTPASTPKDTNWKGKSTDEKNRSRSEQERDSKPSLAE